MNKNQKKFLTDSIIGIVAVSVGAILLISLFKILEVLLIGNWDNITAMNQAKFGFCMMLFFITIGTLSFVFLGSGGELITRSIKLVKKQGGKHNANI